MVASVAEVKFRNARMRSDLNSASFNPRKKFDFVYQNGNDIQIRSNTDLGINLSV